MELSAAGLELIKKSEGFRGNVYLDVEGLPTIGYGHRLVHREMFPKGITEMQATAILYEDVREVEQVLARLVKVPLIQGQFDALVDFVFNLGQGRLAESTLLLELNAGHFAEAGEQLLRWDHAGTEVNAGLKARREAELRLWNSAAREEPGLAS
ncbi:MAG TPA: lysozyme [Terracidiphilus sp.]|nr:lysozyme [Terracidiphilus sp.]